MDPSRKANREDDEITLQYKSWEDANLLERFSDEKLTQLLEFIAHLEQTPVGAADLQRRITLFGECKRIEGETSSQFYGRLRHWLDREVPQTKKPRHPPRQTSD